MARTLLWYRRNKSSILLRGSIIYLTMILEILNLTFFFISLSLLFFWRYALNTVELYTKLSSTNPYVALLKEIKTNKVLRLGHRIQVVAGLSMLLSIVNCFFHTTFILPFALLVVYLATTYFTQDFKGLVYQAKYMILGFYVISSGLMGYYGITELLLK